MSQYITSLIHSLINLPILDLHPLYSTFIIHQPLTIHLSLILILALHITTLLTSFNSSNRLISTHKLSLITNIYLINYFDYQSKLNCQSLKFSLKDSYV